MSVSGPDGSGKTTLINELAGRLEASGQTPIILWSRLGYTQGFEAAKATLRKIFGRGIPQQGDGAGRERVMRRRSVETAWLLAAVADLLFTYAVRVRTLALRGRVAICDRHVIDSLIDRRLFFPERDWVDGVIRRGYGAFGRRPDLALLLSLPYETARERSEFKDEPFPDPPEVRLARHRLYEESAADGSFNVLDATRTPEELAGEIVRLLGDL
jgi:thymidylate kinase